MRALVLLALVALMGACASTERPADPAGLYNSAAPNLPFAGITPQRAQNIR